MTRKAALASLIVCLVSCGGGGGDSGAPAPAPPPPPPPANASPGGIWEGTLSSGEDVLGLVTENGEFHFITEDGVQYFGTLSTNVNAATGNFTGVTAVGTEFADGSTSGTGTLTGTVNARASLTATTSFTTAAGAANANSVTLSYVSLYERDSSLQIAAANYRQINTGDIVNVNANGTAFLQDADTGCVINGTVSIINANFNAYRVQYTYSNCLGQAAILNGRTFNGLATLDNTASPEQFVLAATHRTGNIGLALVFVFERT